MKIKYQHFIEILIFNNIILFTCIDNIKYWKHYYSVICYYWNYCCKYIVINIDVDNEENLIQ